MKTNRFFRRWQRQFRKFFDAQWTLLRASRLEGTADQVHELRVTVRRVRLMLRVARPLMNTVEADRYDCWSRGILNATSRLRDYDATLEWLRRQREASPSVLLVERHRLRLSRSVKTKLKKPPARIRVHLARFEPGHRGKARLEDRYVAHLSRLEETVRCGVAELPGLSPEQRHVVRRKLRRLKYLLEIGLPRRKQAGSQLLKDLVRLQTAMGEHQNLVNAGQILARISRPEIPPALQNLLSQEKSALEKRIERVALVVVRGRKGAPLSKPRRNALIRAAAALPGNGDT